jgi:exodeoxyribonuclease VII small subunit
MTAKKQDDDVNYRQLNDELQHIIESMQENDADIDSALKQYKRGMQIVAELETYLKKVGNSIQDITAKNP